MNARKRALLILLCVLLFVCAPIATYAQPRADKDGETNSALPPFPLGVWLQVPANAPKYKDAGINLYVGLWKGPTETQLAELAKHKMPVLCAQNAVGIAHLKNPIVAGWMQPDEPDNARSIIAGWDDLKKAKVRVQINGSSFGPYGPPVPPSRIVEDYKRMKAVDPTRPVFLNLGQGVVWKFPGRGVRTGHDEDYPKYIEGCDIVSFDVYPAGSTRREIRDKLHLVGDGVAKLRTWAGPAKPAWAIIAANRAGIAGERPTPEEVRAQAWMAIVHGARGIVYFVHHFNPFVEAGLLRDAEMLREVTALNQQITELSPVILSKDLSDRLTVTTDPEAAPAKAILRQHGGAHYVFAVATRPKKTTVTYTVKNLDARKARRIDGQGSVEIVAGSFTDTLDGYGVGLYRIE